MFLKENILMGGVSEPIPVITVSPSTSFTVSPENYKLGDTVTITFNTAGKHLAAASTTSDFSSKLSKSGNSVTLTLNDEYITIYVAIVDGWHLYAGTKGSLPSAFGSTWEYLGLDSSIPGSYISPNTWNGHTISQYWMKRVEMHGIAMFECHIQIGNYTGDLYVYNIITGKSYSLGAGQLENGSWSLTGASLPGNIQEGDNYLYFSASEPSWA